MSQDELIEAYQRGQVGRRTFIRRLLASGVSAAAALTYAEVLFAGPAAADHDFAGDDFYSPGPLSHPVPDSLIVVGASSFSPQKDTVVLGSTVRWRFDADHRLRSNLGLLDSELRGPGYDYETYTRRFIAAGTYPYMCNHNHPAFTGKVIVPLRASSSSGPSGSQFTILWSKPWSSGQGPTAWGDHQLNTELDFVFDVQTRPPGGNWYMWKQGVVARRAKPVLNRTGTWKFRSRVRRVDNGRTSGWSPAKAVEVT